MSAAELATALGGYKVGVGWMARCPAHEDRTPSLSIRGADDGKALVRCHAGCEQAQVIDALRNRGLWASHHDRHRHHSQQFPRSPNHRNAPTDAERSAVALAIWHASAAATGTLAENYLRSRGLCLPPSTPLRFHSGLRHPSGGFWPALVALVTGINGTPLAVHRSFLAADGNGKAPIDPSKMMLGPCRGGAVRLGPVQPDQWLIIAEGIETTLTVVEACGLPGWAALSASGIKNLILPPEASKLLICADNDHNGTGQRAAGEAAQRFLREGRHVRIATPLNSDTDFNDILRLADLGRLDEEARDVA